MRDQNNRIDSRRKSRARSQPRKTLQGTSRADLTSLSVNSLKSKIRDVTRVLEHAHDLPLDIRIEKERALAGYKQDLEKAQHEKERQRMIKKYHMVRFFERQKATRSLKRVRTQLASATRNTPEHRILEDKVHAAEVDLNYTLYHPLTEKYIGIFPRQEVMKRLEKGDTSIQSPAPLPENRPAMWKVVESCMENGTLDALRDGKLQAAATLPLRPPASIKTRYPGTIKKQQGAMTARRSDDMELDEHQDESDGGFFEE